MRDGDKTVVSMLNDYKGELKEFAVVVPVPSVLQKGQINVGDKKIFDRLDAYSAPRLAEYYDSNPCDRRAQDMLRKEAKMTAAPAPAAAAQSSKALGVTVEASYTVGEYDIVILSATQSDGLESWLKQNGYRIPKNSAKALAPYIRQNMKFFVAAVNLQEQAKTGFSMLRPLQFAYESEKFMLPIRLGMANANGPQDLIAYMLTRNGRVETSNYRTVKLPANMDLPVFLKQGDEFRNFYKAMFGEQTKKEGLRAVFTEHFWDMGWCDPCAADPLSPDELRQAGVFWVHPPSSDAAPSPLPAQPRIAPPADARRRDDWLKLRGYRVLRFWNEDTDAGGVVYYANYLKFFERCRTEWMRAAGHDQSVLAAEAGIGFVARQASCEYLRPARLDEELTVGLEVEKLTRVRVIFRQHVRRAAE